MSHRDPMIEQLAAFCFCWCFCSYCRWRVFSSARTVSCPSYDRSANDSPSAKLLLESICSWIAVISSARAPWLLNTFSNSSNHHWVVWTLHAPWDSSEPCKYQRSQLANSHCFALWGSIWLRCIFEYWFLVWLLRCSDPLKSSYWPSLMFSFGFRTNTDCLRSGSYLGSIAFWSEIDWALATHQGSS